MKTCSGSPWSAAAPIEKPLHGQRVRQPRCWSAMVPALMALTALTASSLGLLGCDFLRGYAEGPSSSLQAALAAHPPANDEELGAARFLFDDFRSLNTDSLETNALPWKLVVAAMLTAHPDWVEGTPDEEDWRRLLQSRYGFVRASRVNNWPASTQPDLQRNVGVVAGTIARDVPRIRFEAINHGCATCHAGHLWDAAGQPTRTIWMGLGATSIHLARYSSEVYQGLQRAARDPAPVIAMLDRVYPTLDVDERRTLVDIVLPAVQARLGRTDAPTEPVPFDNGGPGLTNSVGHVKGHFEILNPRKGDAEIAFTQIPELLSMPWRSSVLCDGVYTPTGDAPFVPVTRDAKAQRARAVHLADVATLFTVGTLGVPPPRAHENLPAVQDAMRYVATLESPPFPGPIDDEKVSRGLGVWQARCQACHGEISLAMRDGRRRVQLERFPNALSPYDEIGTDRARGEAANRDVLKVIGTVPVGQRIDAAPRGGYVAPTLLGLWATAPYLHNGSVPTVWHLMHPEARPDRFWQGGHALDYQRLGIAGDVDARPEAPGVYAYAASYVPWMLPDVVDTTTPGRTHVGHVQPFDTMPESEKDDVLELLKLF